MDKNKVPLKIVVCIEVERPIDVKPLKELLEKGRVDTVKSALRATLAGNFINNIDTGTLMDSFDLSFDEAWTQLLVKIGEEQYA